MIQAEGEQMPESYHYNGYAFILLLKNYHIRKKNILK
jgi:hypothetical protein